MVCFTKSGLGVEALGSKGELSMKCSSNLSRSVVLFAAVLSVTLIAAEKAHGAAFIKFAGLVGEAKDKDHKKWSDIISFSQEMYVPNAGVASTRRGTAPVHNPVEITKELDRTSPALADALLTGKGFSTVQIHLTASFTDFGRVTFYSYEFKNVKIVSYKISGSGQAEFVPKEEFSFTFSQVKVTYNEMDQHGKIKSKVTYNWKK